MAGFDRILIEHNSSFGTIVHKLNLLRFRHHYSNSPYWTPYILLSTNWENMFKHQLKTVDLW